jgi:hypothetical protein
MTGRARRSDDGQGEKVEVSGGARTVGDWQGEKWGPGL